MGGRALTEQAKQALGIGLHQTTDDGLFSLEPVYCLGNCACSPAVRIDNQVFGRVSGDLMVDLIDAYREAAGND
jgi:formate dehydrogenase subunit gamma